MPDKGSHSLEQPYSNHLEVGFNALEFVLRFSQTRGDDPPRTAVEIVTNPAFARAFSLTLAEAISSYEARFGPIPGTEDLGWDTDS